MKRTLLAFSITVAIAALPMTSNAANVGASVAVGTTGLGFHMTLPATANVNARIGANYLGRSYLESTAQVDYDLKMTLNTVEALLDWHPLENGFRVTGGLAYNGNKINATGKSNVAGSYIIQGRTYTAANAGTINGSIDFKKIAPYVGIGWGNAIAKEKEGWSAFADVGGLIQGSANTSLTNSGCTAPAPICTQLAADIAAEKQALNDKANKFKVYPVLRIGLSYKF
jgi:hypothetical protein